MTPARRAYYPPCMRPIEVHLEVDSIERSLELYTHLLPHRRVIWDGEPDPQAFVVLEEGSALGLWHRGTHGIHRGRGGRHVHFAFQIAPEEYAHYKAKITEAGLEPLEWEWPDGARSVYFFDPDGHQGEFMTCDWRRRTDTHTPHA